MRSQVPAITNPRQNEISTELADRLTEYQRHAAGAFSPNTERRFATGSAQFAEWCIGAGVSSLPAAPSTVVAYLEHLASGVSARTGRAYKAGSIANALWCIARLHRAAGAPDPTATEPVRLTMRRIRRERGTRADQVAGFNRPAIDAAIGAAGEDLIGLRDRALLAVAYDTLCRRAELVALTVADVQIGTDGIGSILIRKSKTDQEGKGRTAGLAPDTVRHIAAWISAAGITSGPLFRSVRKGGSLGGDLDAGDVLRIFRRLAVRAGINARIGGHSTRVGAAQDMKSAGITDGQIMQAGGWRSPVMVSRYTESIDARKGAAIKLAALQNRL